MLAGKILACKWVKLACKRHLRDYEKSKSDPAFRWYFNWQRANRACKFIELMPHTKGEWAGRRETLIMQDWQVFITCNLFGWVDRESGVYKYREAYICVPRKSGKSAWAAAIGHYKFVADGEFGAEVYSGATTEQQAWEVFRPARLMAANNPQFSQQYGIQVNAKTMARTTDGSRFEPIIGKPGDGSSPSCAIVDEYHEHTDDTLYSTMKTGMGARKNPLLLVITTAGSDRSGPCYAQQIDVQKMLEDKLPNERLFGIIFSIDTDDDWTSQEALRKANPNFDVSVSAEFLHDEQKAAINSARKQNPFKTKHLNIWVNADVSWMNMVAWDKMADPALSVDEFAKQECFIGLDLASRIDIACKIRLFRRVIEGKVHYYCFASHYLNETRAMEFEHYRNWVNENRLIVTPGNVTDLNWIAEGIIEDTKRFVVREIPHDPYQAEPLLQVMRARRDWNQTIEPVAVQPNVQNFSPAMKELEALVVDGRFHHDGDPIMGWMMSNVVCHQDSKDNIYPRKQKDEDKIDGAVAAIMAVSRALVHQVKTSVYETRGMRFL